MIHEKFLSDIKKNCFSLQAAVGTAAAVDTTVDATAIGNTEEAVDVTADINRAEAADTKAVDATAAAVGNTEEAVDATAEAVDTGATSDAVSVNTRNLGLEALSKTENTQHV